MSAPSFTSSSEPVRPGYLKALLGCIVAWAALFFAFTWIVDPYGVSPVRVTIPGINAFKPKRLDIDRLIKPYEVWRYQPKTVFLGTSRIHQAIDPSALDGTRYAGAYNASVPAVSLSMNEDYLEHYRRLDGALQTVVMELFIYNFLGQGQDRKVVTLRDFAANFATLLVSADTLRAALVTLGHNIVKRVPVYEIKPGGNFYYPPGHDARGTFAGFPAGMWDLYKNSPGGYKLSDAAFATVRRINSAARKNGLEIVWIATPNHAYFDYFLELANEWDVVESWLRRLAAEVMVYSFSQPNPWVYEPVSSTMTFWNDPFHFSLKVGEGIQTSLAGLPMPGRPENFMVELTPDRVAEHIAGRRQAIRQWAAQNPAIVAALEQERQKWLATQAAANAAPKI